MVQHTRRDRDTAALVVLFLLVVVTTIGRPLVGLGSLHAADTMQALDPWAQTAPEEFRPDNGTVSDTVDTIAPVRIAIAERARNGDVALWSSTQGGGAPLLGVPNTSMLSPLNLPWWVAPASWAPALAKCLQMLVAGGFLFLFARRVGASRPAAMTGALAFVNAGFLVVWTTWPQSNVAALVPALFWAVDRGLSPNPAGGTDVARAADPACPGRVVALAGIPLVGAAMWLEGFPALTLWAHVFAGAYVVARSRALGIGALRQGVRTIAAMAVGLGVAAVQLLPFGFRTVELDTSSRAAKAADALPWESMATLLAPDALGSAGAGVWYGARNEVEMQAFLGAAGLALVVAALVSRRGRSTVPGWFGFAVTAGVVVGALIWMGGPLHDAVQSLPVLGANQTGRLRALLAFLLAVLVATGFDAVLGAVRERGTALRIAGGSLVAVVLLSPSWWRALDLANQVERAAFVRTALLVPIALLGVVVAAIAVATSVTPGRLRTIALAIVPLVLAFEAVTFARGFLPRIDDDQFYPRVEAHDVVAELVGTDRFAVGGFALYPGTTTAYGLRSITAHAGMPAAWKDLLVEVDAQAYDRNATFPILAPTSTVAGSPTLDVLGVTHFVTALEVPVFGVRDDVLTLGATSPRGAPIHGVDVSRRVLDALGDHELPASLVVELLDATGEVQASGRRRITGREVGPWLGLPLAPTTAGTPPTQGRIEVSILLLDPATAVAGDRPIRAAVDEDVQLRAVRVQPDGLRVVAAPDVVVYERPLAQHRVRFESSVGAVGGAVDLEVDDDEDVLQVHLVAPVDGMLVVADARSGGHRATVDGLPVEVATVHDALVGVPLAPGEHVVRIWWEPEGIRAGAAVTVLSLLGITLVGLDDLRRRRRQVAAP